MVQITGRAHRQPLGDAPTVIVVCALQRAAKATFTGSPLVRVCSTLNLRAMTGGWLGALYLSISRSDPVTSPRNRPARHTNAPRSVARAHALISLKRRSSLHLHCCVLLPSDCWSSVSTARLGHADPARRSDRRRLSFVCAY